MFYFFQIRKWARRPEIRRIRKIDSRSFCPVDENDSRDDYRGLPSHNSTLDEESHRRDRRGKHTTGSILQWSSIFGFAY